MQEPSRVARLALGVATVLVASGTAVVNAAGVSATSPSLTIGVDHDDPANQQMSLGRVFAYTDFFTRGITVVKGTTVDFQTAPGAFHVIGLSSDEAAAKRVYPFVSPDKDDPLSPNGNARPLIGPSNFPIMNGSLAGGGTIAFDRPAGPPLCGVPYEVVQQPPQPKIPPTPPCSFTGGPDVEVAGPNLNFDTTGNPHPADWKVTINAAPGKYRFFCLVHPNMDGTLNVVAPGSESAEEVTTQAQINARSAVQFAHDQAEAKRVETAANVVRFLPGDNGEEGEHGGNREANGEGGRTLVQLVGLHAADDHVSINEMLPNPATVPGGIPILRAGDKVQYLWPDDHEAHTVFFPARPDTKPAFANDINFVGLDCGNQRPIFVPFGNGPPSCGVATGAEAAEGEAIFDPGLTPSSTTLVSPDTTVDSGVLFGAMYTRDYGFSPSVQQWSLRVARSTGAGKYVYHCAIHDWMVGSFSVKK